MLTKEFKIRDIENNFVGLIITFFIITIYAFPAIRPISEIIFYITLSIYFFRNKKTLSKYNIWHSLFIMFCILSIFWTANKEYSLLQIRKLLEWGLVGTLLIAYLDEEKKIYKIFYSIIFSGIILIIKLFIKVPRYMWFTGRISTEEFNPNVIGIYLTISVLLSLFFVLQKKDYPKLFYMALFIFVIINTGSRKALVMIAVGTVSMFLGMAKDVKKKLRNVVLIILFILLLFYLVFQVELFYNILGHRMITLFNAFLGNGKVDGSSIERFNMIRIGKELFKRKPLLGYGVGSYAYVSGLNVYAHNNYYELLVGVGLVGTTLYYSLYIYLIVYLYKMKKSNVAITMLIIVLNIMFIEYGLVTYDGPLYHIVLSLSFGIINLNKSRKLEANE